MYARFWRVSFSNVSLSRNTKIKKIHVWMRRSRPSLQSSRFIGLVSQHCVDDAMHRLRKIGEFSRHVGQANNETIVVIGAGVLGSSIAYHLSRRAAERKCGESSITVLDRNAAGSCATSQSAGLIVHASSCPHKTHFVKQTVKDMREINDDVGLVQNGTIRIAVSEANRGKLSRDVDVARASGVSAKAVDPQEAEELVPWLKVPHTSAMIYNITDDCVADPQIVAGAYLSAARDLGAETRCGRGPQSTVTSLLFGDEDSIRGVRLESGEEIDATCVIDACGSWGGLLLSRASEDAVSFRGLPMAPTRSHYWIGSSASRAELFPPSHPNVVFPDCHAYSRPYASEDGGLILGLQEPTGSLTWDARTVPLDPHLQADLAASQSNEAQELLLNAYDGIAAYMPSIDSLQLQHYSAGMSTYTVDGQYIVGGLVNVPGFFVATGCNGSGLSAAGGIGHHLANHIDCIYRHLYAEGSTRSWKHALSFARSQDDFARRYDPERHNATESFFSEAFRERCAMSRSKKFSG